MVYYRLIFCTMLIEYEAIILLSDLFCIRGNSLIYMIQNRCKQIDLVIVQTIISLFMLKMSFKYVVSDHIGPNYKANI